MKRTLLKTLTYKTGSLAIGTVLVFAATGSIAATLAVNGAWLTVSLAWYALHELLWERR